MDISIKIISNYSDKNKEFLILINNAENEKEYKEKELELNNFVLPLCDNIFPTIQKIEFYKYDKYRDIISKILFDLILCYDQRIREKIKDLLNVVFVKLFKSNNSKQNKGDD